MSSLRDSILFDRLDEMAADIQKNGTNLHTRNRKWFVSLSDDGSQIRIGYGTRGGKKTIREALEAFFDDMDERDTSAD